MQSLEPYGVVDTTRTARQIDRVPATFPLASLERERHRALTAPACVANSLMTDDCRLSSRAGIARVLRLA